MPSPEAAGMSRSRSPAGDDDAAPPRRRSRSRSPTRGDDAAPLMRRSCSPARDSDAVPPRRRSRSPLLRGRLRSPPRNPRNNASGFKWKNHGRNDDGDRNDRKPYRGYREERYHDDKWRRDDRDRGRDRGGDRYTRDDRRDRGRDRDGDRYGAPPHKRDNNRDRDDRRYRPRKFDDDKDKEKKNEKPASKPTAPAGHNEPMIIVTVNDRLGTKATIPCLASDPVWAFKVMVSACIGRPVHEIMLKRQGERPFRDQLTLEDYGVSNGVQLDLELDTGD